MTTHYDKALELSKQGENKFVEMGRELLTAIEKEGISIHDFCIERDRNLYHYDRYRNYVDCARFDRICPDTKVMVLSPTFRAAAYRANADGVDIEDIIEKMLEAAFDGEIYRDKFYTVDWFRVWVRETLGKSPDVDDWLCKLARSVSRWRPMVVGAMERMKGNERYGRIARLLDELERELRSVSYTHLTLPTNREV